MRPEEVVHGLEDGQGPVPGLEGSEAAEGTDPAADGAVEARARPGIRPLEPSVLLPLSASGNFFSFYFRQRK